MRILVSGSSGFIGSELVSLLRKKGNEVVCFSRDSTYSHEQLEGFNAVVHLAGENIVARWTKRKMRNILLSRTVGTRSIAELLSQTTKPPALFISPSAIGYYGNRGEEELTEESLSGVGFLSEVCRSWESSASPLAQRGCRIVHPRFGMVLGKGGLLQRLIPLTKWGLGGILGSGNQWVSWVSLRDALAAIEFALHEPRITGAYNVVAPGVVRQKEFAQSLAAHLRRKVGPAFPPWFMHLIVGSMADELLLASTKVRATKLEQFNFAFRDDSLDKALKFALK